MSKLSALTIAEQSLRANIIEIENKKFLVAGQGQFLTLWTRDFCHATRGLYQIKEFQVASDHLSHLLNSLRDDGLVPRVVDNRLVQLRVAYQSLRRFLPILSPLVIKAPLKPQYTDEHGSEAIDSNLLLLIAALEYSRLAPDGKSWWESHESQLKKVWHWYDTKLVGGLVFQSGFSDWQDSVKREGVTFLTNLFYFLVAKRLKEKNWSIAIDLSLFRSKLIDTFFDKTSGVYLSHAGSPQVSLEGNLFALEADEFLSQEQKKDLWSSLKRHTLLKVPGSCSYPDWPRDDIAWHVKLAGLDGYHGSVVWSWLIGLLLKVAYQQDDTEMLWVLEARIEELLYRDGVVMEVYDPSKNWKPWSSWLVYSEHPFSWGAAYMIESLSLSKDF